MHERGLRRIGGDVHVLPARFGRPAAQVRAARTHAHARKELLLQSLTGLARHARKVVAGEDGLDASAQSRAAPTHVLGPDILVGRLAHGSRLGVVVRALDVEVAQVLGRVLADAQVADGHALSDQPSAQSGQRTFFVSSF